MCGLFAWNGKNIEDFDWSKFNILGLLNDTRGGDSCGRSFGNYELKGIDAKSDYEVLVKTYYNDNLDANTIFGHTRKASVGAVSIKTAQPITITDEDDKIKFHLIHNGTLHNHEELAKKYNVDYIGKTDSQVLASIIYEHGYAVLSEYNGAASLVFGWSDTPNIVYAWRGASKITEFATVISDERPLNYFQESKNSMYINSLVEPLRFIGGDIAGDDISIHEFEANKLHTIVDGEIIDKHEIKRDDSFQRKTTYFNQNRSNHIRNNYATSNSSGSQTEIKPVANDIEIDEAPDAIKATETLIYYAKGRYWYNKEFAHGIFFVNSGGIASTNQPSKKEEYETFYFIRGVMMIDHTSFNLLAKKFKKGKRSYKNRNCENDEDFAQLLRHSRYPIQSWIGRQRSSGFLKKNGIPSQNGSTNTIGHYFTGEFSPLFSARAYSVNVGNYTGFTGVPYNSPESLAKKEITVSESSLVDAESEVSGHGGSEDDTPFITTDDDNINSCNIDEYQYDDDMVSEEVKTILRDVDRVIMEAKSRVEQIGPTTKTTLALDLLEELQEKIDTF